ncbi:hypothetical protein RBSH_04179 [Rhodopirellula baltica SH28]|uniref:Uncharacterized protein n=2 Tax=Rhodopirellula baltica TaxID=265606 RepID=F2AQ59_RHOBT|nr:hypothetical protein RBWH47_02853 [Rhodopirellula baltica WH47]EKK00452.1 hypothetical protein RBSH_04179 [Rhodopirellula baltica SH28]
MRNRGKTRRQASLNHANHPICQTAAFILILVYEMRRLIELEPKMRFS